MILAFLRLFSQFRDYEAARQSELEDTQKALELAISERDQLEVDMERLQVRLDAAEDERARLWQRLDVAVIEERRAYQSHVNIAWQKMGGGTPYPEAPALSPESTPKLQAAGPIGRRGRILPSQVVAAKRREMIQGIVTERAEQAKRAG